MTLLSAVSIYVWEKDTRYIAPTKTICRVDNRDDGSIGKARGSVKHHLTGLTLFRRSPAVRTQTRAAKHLWRNAEKRLY